MLNRFSPILVVNDRAPMRLAIKGMFESLGHMNVDGAAGVEALWKLEVRHYSLIVSDWFMEPMSGLELLAKLRRSEHFSRTPLIMIVPRSQKKFMEIARDAGATHYLAKPFRAEELAAKIKGFKKGFVSKLAQPVVATRRRSMA